MKPETPKAAIYLRSSKDRSDVSLDAQRRDLERLAAAKGLTIIREFADAVESGKSDMRAGFQALLRELRSPTRTWMHLLLLDTSRLSRRQYMAYVFDHECARRGITVLYSKVPETDPITDMVIKGVLRVFDEFHSLMSREKGLAGMAENVRQGWRAGGRAPRGYILEAVQTGAIREGEPVWKSRLIPGPDADVMARYLKARAGGSPRTRMAAELRITSTGLVDLEWNALTYAGHTVWNMRYPHERGYMGGKKRRPRSEWLIQRDTHPALITDSEAECILSVLESSKHGKPKRIGSYLLSGLLQSPTGMAWQGDGRDRYRTKLPAGQDRTISAKSVESAVLKQISSDMNAPGFVKEIVKIARERYVKPADDLKAIRDQLRALTRQIAKMMDMALEMQDRAPALRRIEQMEGQRTALEHELQERETLKAATIAIEQITESRVSNILNSLAFRLDTDRAAIKDSLLQLLEKIILDPETGECRLYYRINPVIRVEMASPTVDERNPNAIRWDKALSVKPFQKRRRGSA